MLRSSVFDYQEYRYLKLACALVLASTLAYLWFEPAVGHYGGSWLGYGLGTVSAFLVFWLAWYGIRKRRYRQSGSTQAWLSAHIYLGTTLLVTASLHSGFHFGLNIHTVAYVLLLIVIASGLFGSFAYLIYPRQMTDNMGEDNLNSLLLRIADADKHARQIALLMPDEINDLVAKACQETQIGADLLEQLRGYHLDCPSALAVQQLAGMSDNLSTEQRKLYRELYSIMVSRQSLIKRIRQDLMYRARLGIWLYVHVPFAIALLLALTIHIVSVFIYW
ncbi:MAG: hypothetical protein HOP21_10845 [Methylotenera sp.]|nr:hypothetical protein [Methylotenera sp.]